MKAYIVKTGYSSGIYGCSDEHFAAIFGDNMIRFSGLYGAEHRVADELKAKGYDVTIHTAVYGKVTGNDKKWSISEAEAINEIKSL